MPASHVTLAATSAAAFMGAVEVATLVVGVAFLTAGTLGFIPGVTTNINLLTLANHRSGATLFGLFGVSVLHNLVHLTFGSVALLLVRTFSGARAYLVGGGLTYLMLATLDIVFGHDGPDLLSSDDPGDWLHLGVAVAMITLGVALGRMSDNASRPTG